MYRHMDVQDRGETTSTRHIDFVLPVVVAERKWYRLPLNLISSLKNSSIYSSSNVSYCTAT